MAISLVRLGTRFGLLFGGGLYPGFFFYSVGVGVLEFKIIRSGLGRV